MLHTEFNASRQSQVNVLKHLNQTTAISNQIVNIVDDFIAEGKLCLEIKAIKGKSSKIKTAKMKALQINVYSDSQRFYLCKIAEKPLEFKAVIKEYADNGKDLPTYETLANKCNGYEIIKGNAVKKSSPRNEPTTKKGKKSKTSNNNNEVKIELGNFDLSALMTSRQRPMEKVKAIIELVSKAENGLKPDEFYTAFSNLLNSKVKADIEFFDRVA